MRWPLLESVRTRLADEQGTLRKQARTRIALCYPSPYQVGMSSLGYQTIYREIHAHDDATAERAFLPDDASVWRAARVPLCTYESQQPVSELRSMFLIEPERGCSRGCTYCVMRRTTNGGMRTVDPQRVLELIPEGARKVGLVGAAVTDHPGIVDLVRALVEDGREVGISSLRADRLCARPELVSLLAKSGARTLTTAADGASERLRTALDRKTNAAQLVKTAELAREAGFARLKLYLMVGLPGEEDADLDELADLGKEISRIVPLSFGCAPFVAKRNTPMDGAPWAGVAEAERKLAFLRAKLRGRAEIRPTSARWAFVEYMLAPGGREAGLAAEDAWRDGGSFAAFRKAFERRSVRPHAARRTVDGRLRLPALAAWARVSA